MMADIFKENGWYFNKNEYCSICNKLKYTGYTTYPDRMHCLCHNSDNISTYIDDDRLPILKKEINYEH